MPFGNFKGYKIQNNRFVPPATKVMVVKPKRKYRKKKRALNLYSRSLGGINTTPFLPPKKWAFNMPYHEVVTLTVPGTPETAATLVWSINGLFDPEVPVGGHQPMGFDQAMTFYDHYTCVASSWTVTFATMGSQNTPLAVGYYISPSSTPLTGSDAIVENGMMKRKIATFNLNNSKDINTLSGQINLSKYFGKKIINEDDYRGDAASLPAEQAYLIFFANTLSATTGQDIVLDITTNYTVLFSEPRKVPQS